MNISMLLGRDFKDSEDSKRFRPVAELYVAKTADSVRECF